MFNTTARSFVTAYYGVAGNLPFPMVYGFTAAIVLISLLTTGMRLHLGQNKKQDLRATRVAPYDFLDVLYKTV